MCNMKKLLNDTYLSGYPYFNVLKRKGVCLYDASGERREMLYMWTCGRF